MIKIFDIKAERKYYQNSPQSWKKAPDEAVETLMSFTAGPNWQHCLFGKDVLELGAGECTYLPYLLETAKPSRYLATDIFEDRFKLARNVIASKYPNLEFCVLQAQKIEMPDNSFDIVLAFGLYHHFPNLGQAFRQAWRVLKPGGTLIFRDPYAGNPVILLKFLMIKTSMNERPLSISKTRKLLTQAGFHVERVHRFWLRFPKLPAGPWSTNIGVVARKNTQDQTAQSMNKS